jgi:hypothetical protein
VLFRSLAPREELAAAARVAPLLRAAADLSRWADEATARFAGDALAPADALAAAAALELTTAEVEAAWQVVVATGLRDADSDNGAARLDQQEASEVLGAWDAALAAILDAEELDGLATALYTVGAPVRIDALFEAYSAAAGDSLPTAGGPDTYSPDTRRPALARPARPDGHEPDEAAALSGALETLADLGVVELGTEEAAGGLTVALSPLGVWGVHRRLRGQGWHVPVLGSAGRDGAVGLLMTLASCDAEDGEAEIGTWLAGRSGPRAARELIKAASTGSPGLRGAAFAVLDRIGDAATRRSGPRWPIPCCAPTPRYGCMSTARKPSCGPRTGPGCWSTSAPGCWRRPTRWMWSPSCCPRCPPRPRPTSWPGSGASTIPA